MLKIQISITLPHSYHLVLWFSSFNAHQNHLEDLNHRLLGSTFTISNSVTLRSDHSVCIFDHRSHLDHHCGKAVFLTFFEIIILVRNNFTLFFWRGGWACHSAFRILVPPMGIKPMPPTEDMES